MKSTDIGNPAICSTVFLFKYDSFSAGLRSYSESKTVRTLPGGRCHTSELIEQALKREVFEETGISDMLIGECIGIVAGAKQGDIVPIYHATTSQDAELKEPEKFLDWKWITKHDLLKDRSYIGINPLAVELVLNFLSA